MLPRNTRLDPGALPEAVAASLGEEANAAHRALLAMLEKVDQGAAAADIEVMLSGTLGGEPCAAGSGSILARAYAALARVSEQDAAAILAREAAPFGFRYDVSAPARPELVEFIDARLNAVLVTHLMRALNASIAQGEINREICLAITERILADGRTRTNPAYIAALERCIRRLQEAEPGKPIVYLSVGCGSGREDVDIVAELKRRLPGLDLLVVGFDPNQCAERHLISTALGGTMIDRELAPGETFASVVRDATGATDAAIITTERYALHHMGRSPAAFLAEIEGATLVSVEEPVTEQQRTSLPHRLASIGYDILANHALEQRFGGSWIAEARQNPELFRALYRRLEALKCEESNGLLLEQVGGVHPLTCVITYPARGGRAV